MKRMGLKDIAEMAGVSQMTVSRVINAPETVKADTRERVEKIIVHFGYRPNTIARALTTGKTMNVGLVVIYDAQFFPNAFMSAFLKGVSDVVRSFGYNLMLFFEGHEGDNPLNTASGVSANRLDGLMILAVDSNLEILYPVYMRWRETGLPVVVINQRLEDPKASFVDTDDFGGAERAASYLIARGHKKIGFIAGPDQYAVSLSRFRGFLHALEANGLMLNPNAYAEGGCTKEGGYHAMQKLLSGFTDMTAVLCASDRMALGAMKCCFDKGISIPDGMSVMGYDDQEFSSMLNPALTTVKKDRQRMGVEAAGILMNQILEGDEPVQKLIPAEIIARESVKAI